MFATAADGTELHWACLHAFHRRPAVLVIHGGGFVGGTSTSSAESVSCGRDLPAAISSLSRLNIASLHAPGKLHPDRLETRQRLEVVHLRHPSAGRLHRGHPERERCFRNRTLRAFDLDPVSSRISNISTRGEVGTGNAVMIGGFIIGGEEPTKRCWCRAIGPSLVASNIPNVLADPLLELYNSAAIDLGQRQLAQRTDAADHRLGRRPYR